MTLHKHGDAPMTSTEYPLTAGGLLLMILAANDFIRHQVGNAVSVDSGRFCNFYFEPIDFACLHINN